MSGLVPIPARHSGALVPARRTARVEPAPHSADVRDEPRGRADAQRRSGARPQTSAPLSPEGVACLQTGPVRRGLRADACERQRYHAAYAASMHLGAPSRPRQERAA
ncbi:hypothetical protein L2D01_03375 [Hyphomonadaceae bacterium ML37]|nr:hypothetical protein L2D01_03375 [Hyphomonadaceae bacterium ML37]